MIVEPANTAIAIAGVGIICMGVGLVVGIIATRGDQRRDEPAPRPAVRRGTLADYEHRAHLRAQQDHHDEQMRGVAQRSVLPRDLDPAARPFRVVR